MTKYVDDNGTEHHYRYVLTPFDGMTEDFDSLEKVKARRKELLEQGRKCQVVQVYETHKINQEILEDLFLDEVKFAVGTMEAAMKLEHTRTLKMSICYKCSQERKGGYWSWGQRHQGENGINTQVGYWLDCRISHRIINDNELPPKECPYILEHCVK